MQHGLSGQARSLSLRGVKRGRVGRSCLRPIGSVPHRLEDSLPLLGRTQYDAVEPAELIVLVRKELVCLEVLAGLLLLDYSPLLVVSADYRPVRTFRISMSSFQQLTLR